MCFSRLLYQTSSFDSSLPYSWVKMVNLLNSIVPHATEFMAKNIPFAKHSCSFGMDDIDRIRKSDIFPPGAENRGYDFFVRPAFICLVWVFFQNTLVTSQFLEKFKTFYLNKQPLLIKSHVIFF